MSKGISFFATPDDQRRLLHVIENTAPVKYIRAGLFDNSEPEIIYSLAQQEGFGISETGRHPVDMYLVCEHDNSIAVRPVPQRRGGVKFAINQLENPDTISFFPSGIYLDSVIIDGTVGTVSDSAISLRLYQLFQKTMRTQFIRVGAYRIGEQALQLLDSGWRLAHSAHANPKFDLKQ